MIPMKMPCRQLMIAVMKMENEQVAVAWSGLHPNIRNIGTRKRPPPSPKPEKMPANMLYFIT